MDGFLELCGVHRAALLVALLSGIPLLVSLVVGLVVGILQAATQIQEQTLSFIPKLTAVGVLIALLGPWLITQFVECLSLALQVIPVLDAAARTWR